MATQPLEESLLSVLDRPATIELSNPSDFPPSQLKAGQILPGFTLTETNSLISELGNTGGRVILTDAKIVTARSLGGETTTPAGFAVDSEGKPVLLITRQATPDQVAHELEHFIFWKKLRDLAKSRAESRGKPLNDDEAGRRGIQAVNHDPTLMHLDETAAVSGEMRRRYQDFMRQGAANFDQKMAEREGDALILSGNAREMIPDSRQVWNPSGFDFVNPISNPKLNALRYEYQRSLYPFSSALKQSAEIHRSLTNEKYRLEIEIETLEKKQTLLKRVFRGRAFRTDKELITGKNQQLVEVNTNLETLTAKQKTIMKELIQVAMRRRDLILREAETDPRSLESRERLANYQHPLVAGPFYERLLFKMVQEDFVLRELYKKEWEDFKKSQTPPH